MAENARRISDQGKEIHDRISVWAGHLSKLRDSLEKAVSAFNDSIGSLERRVLISSRRIKEFGVSSDRTVPEITSVEIKPHELRELEPDKAVPFTIEPVLGTS